MNRIILVASIAVLLSSCVSKKKFAELTSQYDECKVSLNEKDASLSKLAVKIDGLDSQLASAVKQNESLQNSQFVWRWQHLLI